MNDDILNLLSPENLTESEVLGRQIAEINFIKEEKNLFNFDKPENFDVYNELREFNNTFEKLELSAEVDLGEVKLILNVEGSSKPIDASLMQMFIKREYLDFEGKPMIKWENITPTTDKGYLKFSIYANDKQSFKFDIKPGIGKYSAARIIFFADGWKVLADQTAIVTPFEVVTTQIRIKKPTLEILEDKILCPNENNKIIIPFVLKFPPHLRPPWNAWWAMAKGASQNGSLFQQKWLQWGQMVNNVMQPTEICKISDGPDKYWYVESQFEIDYPKDTNIYNVQFGVFDNNWKETYHWIYPGIDLEVGGTGWITRCPDHKLPPRLRVSNGKFVKLDGSIFNFYQGTKGADGISAVRGASWGNAYGWTRTPEFNRSGFFSSLRYIGHRICRFLFDPDQYTSSEVYRHRILDSIGKILSGGMYPLCGPHNLHVNVSSPAERDKKFLEMCAMIAEDWKGLPIMYAIASEPKELTGGWAECKPLWEKATKIIRNIDPDAFLIVPCQGYSKTSTAPEAADLLDKNLVDAYSYHPYNSAKDVIPFMKPLLDTGVGIIVEEYGCGNAVWQKSINIEMQKISKQYPNLLAFLTWAWTKYGQDACPMVENGDLANITLTEVGKMQALDIATWDSGKLIDESGSVAPPSVDSDGNLDTGGSGTGNTSGIGNTSGSGIFVTTYTKSQIDEMFVTKLDFLRKEFSSKFEDINRNSTTIINTISSLNQKIDLLSDKLEVISNKELPYVLIQDYVTQLANCKLLSISLAPNSIVQNKTTSLVINLTSPAPKGGAVIYLNSTDSKVTLPQIFKIDEGLMTASTVVTALSTTAQFTSRISATFNGKTITSNLAVKVK